MDRTIISIMRKVGCSTVGIIKEGETRVCNSFNRGVTEIVLCGMCKDLQGKLWDLFDVLKLVKPKKQKSYLRLLKFDTKIKNHDLWDIWGSSKYIKVDLP